MIIRKLQDSLENVTTKGSIPIPNEAAPRRPAVKMAELRLMAALKADKSEQVLSSGTRHGPRAVGCLSR